MSVGLTTGRRIARGAFVVAVTGFVVAFAIAAADFIGPWTGLALCMFFGGAILLSGAAWIACEVYQRIRNG